MARKKQIQTGYFLKYIPKGRLNDLKELANNFPHITNKDIALSKYIEFISSLIERSLETDSKQAPVNFDYQRKLLGLDNGMKQFIQSLIDAKFIQQDTSTFKIGYKSYEYKPIYDEVEIIKIEKKQLNKKTNQMLTGGENLSEELSLYKDVLNKITINNTIYNDINNIIKDIRNRNTDTTNTNNPFNYSFVPYAEILKDLVSTHYSSVPSDKTGESSLLPNYSSVPFTSIGALPVELASLYKIMTGNIKVQRPLANSRVYSNITNLSRLFRPYLQLNGKSLIGFDIANSQPLIAAIPFRRYSEMKLGEGNIAVDVLEYQKTCESGSFYEYFMKLNNIDTNCEDARTAFKKKFFGQVFYSMNYEKTPALLQQFIDKYPTCYEAIYQLKGGKWYSKTYKDFPALMTEIETSIMWEANIELIKEGFDVVNIFDSLYSDSKEAIDKAKQLVKDKFALYGIKPTLKDINYTDELSAIEVPTDTKELVVNPYVKRKAAACVQVEIKKAMTRKEFYQSNPYYATISAGQFNREYQYYVDKFNERRN